jgi:hypothetical protein
MMRLTISTSTLRTILQRIFGFVVGTILFLLMMLSTVLLMAALEPSFFSNWF